MVDILTLAVVPAENHQIQLVVEPPVPAPHFQPRETSVIVLYTAGNEQFLEHRLIGEVVQLARLSSDGWRLRNANRFGYITANGTEPLWVNDLFMKTMWSNGGVIALRSVVADHEVVLWLAESRARRSYSYASWHDADAYCHMSH